MFVPWVQAHFSWLNKLGFSVKRSAVAWCMKQVLTKKEKLVSLLNGESKLCYLSPMLIHGTGTYLFRIFLETRRHLFYMLVIQKDGPVIQKSQMDYKVFLWLSDIIKQKTLKTFQKWEALFYWMSVISTGPISLHMSYLMPKAAQYSIVLYMHIAGWEIKKGE